VTWTHVYLFVAAFTSRPNCYWPLTNVLSFYLRFLHFCPKISHHCASEAGMPLSVSVPAALIFYLINGILWSKLEKKSGGETCLFIYISYRECNIYAGRFSVVCWKCICIYRHHLKRLTKTWSISFYKCIIAKNLFTIRRFRTYCLRFQELYQAIWMSSFLQKFTVSLCYFY